MLKQYVKCMIIHVNGFNKNTSLLFSGLDFHCIKNKIINKKKTKLSFSQKAEIPFQVLGKEIFKIWIFSGGSLLISPKTSFLQQFQFCWVCQDSYGHIFSFLPLSGKSHNSFKVKPQSDSPTKLLWIFWASVNALLRCFFNTMYRSRNQKPPSVSF